MQKIENIEELMKSVQVNSKKSGNVAKICDVTVQMLKVRPNGVSIGLIGRTTAKVLNVETIEYSVVRHAVLKSRQKDKFEVFDGPDGKMVRMK